MIGAYPIESGKTWMIQSENTAIKRVDNTVLDEIQKLIKLNCINIFSLNGSWENFGELLQLSECLIEQ